MHLLNTYLDWYEFAQMLTNKAPTSPGKVTVPIADTIHMFER